MSQYSLVQSSEPGFGISPGGVRGGPPMQRGINRASSIRSVARAGSTRHSSISEKYSLEPAPASWGLHMHMQEEDDALHDPSVETGNGRFFSVRGILNIGCLLVLVMALLTLFAGFPLISFFVNRHKQTDQGGFNLGGINASGQIPEFSNFGLIDSATPQSAYSRSSYADPTQEMQLVFSDEFETEGRTFYPGDDPFWEAVDLHYWGTVDLEWYDPMQATTKDGSLQLTISKVSDITDNHNLTYRSGMIQSWNKFCFTGGIIETKVVLPGSSTVSGLWPAVWTMGNLGRAGYGASLDGMWPYSYDSCDVGTLAGQVFPGTSEPAAALEHGDPLYKGVLSMLPGQKLSACTCKGESHPGPIRNDGSTNYYVGRAAPEIDIFEAIVTNEVGGASVSAQWAPFNAGYNADTTGMDFLDNSTIHNTYQGGGFQQTTSGLTNTNPDCYELNTGCFSTYAFEYKPGFDDGYITWVKDDQPTWTLHSSAVGPDTNTQIGQRIVSQEPMYIIANLGLSLGFGTIDFDNLAFPATMSIDYIRVYQHPNSINIGCDPNAFPTAKYIETYPEAYTNPNLTQWVKDYNQTFPKNSQIDVC